MIVMLAALCAAAVLAVEKAPLATGTVAGGTSFAIGADDAAVELTATTAGEAVEFFFIPDGGAFEYYSFRIAKDGTKEQHFYSEFGGIEPDPYGAVWTARVKPGEKGKWSVSASLPLACFYMTRSEVWKTTWKANVAAYAADGAASTWSGSEPPTAKAKFLSAFKAVKGFPALKKTDDFFIRAVKARVTGVKDGKPVGKLLLTVEGWKDADHVFAGNWLEKQTKRVPFGGGTVELDAVFPGEGRHPITIGVRRPDGRTFGRTWPLYVDYRPVDLKLTTPQYRSNFYPGQPSDRIEGRVRSLSGLPMTVVLEGDGLVRQTREVGRDATFSFDTKGLPVGGEAMLTVTCGKETCVRRVRRLKPRPDGYMMTWIENGNLVVNGKPVARRNIYAEGYMGGKAFDEKYRADNLFMTTNVTCVAYLDPAWYSKDLRYNELKRDQKPSARMREWLDKNIDKALKSPTGAYYYISDEPECSGMSPVQLRHIYEYVAERDPYHVVLSASRSGDRYADIADWFETHPYINAHYDAEGNRVYGRDFRDLGSFVDAFHPTEHPDKCVGGLPTCFTYPGAVHPTFDEYRLNYWCEFVRGAKTMYPYAYHDLGDRPSLYEGTRYMFESMQALEDVLLFGKIKTLVRTDDYECGLWTMPAGDRMFAIVNFTQKPQTVTVPGLVGNYREFRGTRTFKLSSAQPSTFSLQPHEALVACEKTRDAGLRTLAEVQKAIADAEYARTHRGNQLCERHEDMEIVTSTGCRGAWYDSAMKVFDGTRDVIAWRHDWGKEKFFEMSFMKFVPSFREITLYGHNIDGFVVKIRANGEWTTLTPVSTEKDGYRQTLKFAQSHSTVKMRIEFPGNLVQLYEIELPGKAREIAANAQKPEPKGVHWTLETPPFDKLISFPVKQPAERSFLVFELGKLMFVDDQGYKDWQMYLEPDVGFLCREVLRTFPGLYTIALPPSKTGAMRDSTLRVYDWNIRFGLGTVVCCAEPADYALLTEREGRYHVRVKLAAPCEDVVCAFYQDTGRGQGPFKLSNGRNSLDLKPADATRTVWEGSAPVKVSADAKVKPFPYICVNVLGGTLSQPIYTWLAK